MTSETTTTACTRTPLSMPTKRRLWSDSGGHCANPECARWLFDDASGVDFAEMAHIVAATAGGPRDVSDQTKSSIDRADQANLVVLCASCHTVVDKAPEAYPTEMLLEWKEHRRAAVHQAAGTPVFSTRDAARQHIEPLLDANRAVFEAYGSSDADFSDERAEQWHRHALATIVPNNGAIVRVLARNAALLMPAERSVAGAFKIHVKEFADRHVLGIATATSTLFPSGMETILTKAWTEDPTEGPL